MDREDQVKWLTGAGVVAGLALLFVFCKKRGGPPNEVFADITVQANGTVSYHPETIDDASIGNRDFVIWRVKNLSRDRVKVCVTKFKNENHGTLEDPLDDVDGQDKCRKVPAGDSRNIRTQVKRSARKGYYKYSIFLNDAEAVDPRLSIVD